VQPTPTEIAAPSQAAAPDDARVSVATIERNIPHALAQLMDEAQANVLAQTLTRALVWNVIPHRDLRRGDELRVLWSPDGEGARVHALHFESERYGKTFEAYAWQASDSSWPSYYDEEGTEVPLSLRYGPLAEYEQITSLLDDRPDHHGMDFMTPVGTPVLAPFNGTVHATNWNERYNGQCIELRSSDGLSAKFLHLSAVEVSAGATVTRGQAIGQTGNTGRSTGPHLHYELARGGSIVDPLDFHDTYRRELPAADRPAYAAHVAAVQARLHP
jgi:murein DD-endopeptidase MepM/ murein hydrolase activator NlpD